jgi:hypothetical protein
MSDETTTEEASEPISEADAAAVERAQADIDALLYERRGYVARGLNDRIAAVDEQLRLRGVEPPADADGDGKSTAVRRGRGKGRTAEA